jgi:hypothetical protein
MDNRNESNSANDLVPFVQPRGGTLHTKYALDDALSVLRYAALMDVLRERHDAMDAEVRAKQGTALVRGVLVLPYVSDGVAHAHVLLARSAWLAWRLGFSLSESAATSLTDAGDVSGTLRTSHLYSTHFAPAHFLAQLLAQLLCNDTVHVALHLHSARSAARSGIIDELRANRAGGGDGRGGAGGGALLRFDDELGLERARRLYMPRDARSQTMRVRSPHYAIHILQSSLYDEDLSALEAALERVRGVRRDAAQRLPRNAATANATLEAFQVPTNWPELLCIAVVPHFAQSTHLKKLPSPLKQCLIQHQ